MTEQPAERMIPILPCASIDDQLAFYESLGFEVTYRQKAPNVYASIQRGGIELHFFVMKGYDPANSYSSCYVFVRDIDSLYAEFRAGLKRSLGRIPTRGIPAGGFKGRHGDGGPSAGWSTVGDGRRTCRPPRQGTNPEGGRRPRDGDDALAVTLLDHVARAVLDVDDRAALADELARADDLRRTLA